MTEKRSSTWSSPNPVLYGSGSSSVTGDHLKKYGCSKVMVVYDKGVADAGVADRVISYIEKSGIVAIRYDKCLSDTPDYIINDAARIARQEQVDGVVAVGGGSSIDTGKGVCLLLSNEPPINLYFAQPSLPSAGDVSNLKPLIVLPTTSGTGSEVTPGGAVADTNSNTKQNFVCPVTLGIIDPELALGLPPKTTAATAFDAMCHAVEAVISREPNPFSELYGAKALTLIGENLTKAVTDGSDLEAREGLSLAATMASMAILGPFCNIPHDTGAVVCMRFHLHHGLAVSMCLPEILRFAAISVPDKVLLVGKCLGATIPECASIEDIGDLTAKRVTELMNAAGLPRIPDLIESKQALLDCVPEIMQTQSFYFSPRKVTKEDIEGIFERSWSAR